MKIKDSHDEEQPAGGAVNLEDAIKLTAQGGSSLVAEDNAPAVHSLSISQQEGEINQWVTATDKET